MPKVHSHYENLKIPRDASAEAIRVAYRTLSQKHHPDRNPNQQDATRIMSVINTAYETLSDPAKRRRHDQWIALSEGRRAESKSRGTSGRRRSSSSESPRHRSRQAAKPEPAPEARLVSDHLQRYRFRYGLALMVLLAAWALLRPVDPLSDAGPFGASTAFDPRQYPSFQTSTASVSPSSGYSERAPAAPIADEAPAGNPAPEAVSAPASGTASVSPRAPVAERPPAVPVSEQAPEPPVSQKGPATRPAERTPAAAKNEKPPAAPAPAPLAARTPVQALPQGQAFLNYQKPATAPNGQPWPAQADYVKGYQMLRAEGYSNVTLDNSRNGADVFAKLVYLDGAQAIPARIVFIPAFGHMTLSKITAGSYDLRYRDLNTGDLARTDPFQLKESPKMNGVEFTSITVQVLRARAGAMGIHGLSENEF